MTAEIPAEVTAAFDRTDAFETHETGYGVTTTVFDATVTVVQEGDSMGANREQTSGGGSETDHPSNTGSQPSAYSYRVTVRVPTLAAATEDAVGPTVARDWLETLERRLENAPKSTRARVSLDSFGVCEEGQQVEITYEFTWSNPNRAADIAKTFVEYVEGTYVEGIVPGYEYVPPVSDLLSNASQSGTGGTPL